MLNSQYLQFDVAAPERFPTLLELFEALQCEKQIVNDFIDGIRSDEDAQPENEPNWRDYLDGKANAWFADVFNFDSEEGKVYQQLWELTEPQLRFDHPMFQLPGNWDFDSMIDSLFDKECTYDRLVRLSPAEGKLIYTPLALPFGGTESLVALIEAFGQTVTFDSWRGGPHKRRVVGWNFDRAQQLVAAGQGVTWENLPVN